MLRYLFYCTYIFNYFKIFFSNTEKLRLNCKWVCLQLRIHFMFDPSKVTFQVAKKKKKEMGKTLDSKLDVNNQWIFCYFYISHRLKITGDYFIRSSINILVLYPRWMKTDMKESQISTMHFLEREREESHAYGYTKLHKSRESMVNFMIARCKVDHFLWMMSTCTNDLRGRIRGTYCSRF